jgi:MoxR-like ATPase
MAVARDLIAAERRQVKRVARQLEELEGRAAAVREERDRLFAELLDDGASPTRIALQSNLSGEAVRAAARRYRSRR